MTILILLACAIGIVWGAIFVMRSSLLAGCLAVVLLNCCFGAHFFSFDAGITWTLDRIGLMAVTAAFVTQLHLGRIRLKPLCWADYAVLGWLAVVVVSALSHDRTPSHGMELNVIHHMINGYLMPGVLYFIARQSSPTEKQISQLLPIAILFGVYLAGIGILESLGQWSLVFPRYIADPELGLHFGRARGPMVHSVSYGLYLSACMLGLWIWAVQGGPRRWVIMLILLPVILAAIYLTKTRSVWLGAATGIFIVLWYTLQGRMRMAVLGSMIAVGAVLAATKMDSLIGFQREFTTADTAKSVSMRGSFAYVSWLMFQDRPLTGFGFGQFQRAKLPYLSDRSTTLHLESIREYVHHNTFLSVLVETGLIGFLLAAATFIAWITNGFKLLHSRASPRYRSVALLMLATLAVAFWQALFHEITFTPIDMSLLFFISGVTVNVSTAARAESTAELVAPAPQTPARMHPEAN